MYLVDSDLVYIVLNALLILERFREGKLSQSKSLVRRSKRGPSVETLTMHRKLWVRKIAWIISRQIEAG